MPELLQESLRPINLVFTVLLGIVILYWLMVILGVFDIELVDFDLESDLLGVFGLGELPTMVPVTIFVFSSWALSILSNHYWNPESIWASGLLLIPNFFVSGVLTSAVAFPFRKFFKQLEEDVIDHLTVVGHICRITSGQVDSTYGQAEVEVSDSQLLVNVRTQVGEELHKGDEAILVEYVEEDDHYLVAGIEKGSS